MARLGDLGRSLLPVGYQLAVLPVCAMLASTVSSGASANPLGGNVLAGAVGAQIAIAVSGAAHIDVGARQTNISNNSPAGHPDTTTVAPAQDFSFLPSEIDSAEQDLAATVSADQKFEKDEINLAEKDFARAGQIAVDASGGFQ